MFVGRTMILPRKLFLTGHQLMVPHTHSLAKNAATYILLKTPSNAIIASSTSRRLPEVAQGQRSLNLLQTPKDKWMKIRVAGGLQCSFQYSLYKSVEVNFLFVSSVPSTSNFVFFINAKHLRGETIQSEKMNREIQLQDANRKKIVRVESKMDAPGRDVFSPAELQVISPGLAKLFIAFQGFQITNSVPTNPSSIAPSERIQSLVLTQDLLLQIIQLTQEISDLSCKLNKDAGMETRISVTVAKSVSALRSVIHDMDQRCPSVLIVVIFETDSFDVAHVFGMLKYILTTTTAIYSALMMYLKELEQVAVNAVKEITILKQLSTGVPPIYPVYADSVTSCALSEKMNREIQLQDANRKKIVRVESKMDAPGRDIFSPAELQVISPGLAKLFIAFQGFQITNSVPTNPSSIDPSDLLLQIIQLTQKISILSCKLNGDAGMETRTSITVAESVSVILDMDQRRPSALIADIFEMVAFNVADEFGMLKYILITTTAIYSALMMYLPASWYIMAQGILINACEELEQVAVDALKEIPILKQLSTCVTGVPPIYPVYADLVTSCALPEKKKWKIQLQEANGKKIVRLKCKMAELQVISAGNVHIIHIASLAMGIIPLQGFQVTIFIPTNCFSAAQSQLNHSSSRIVDIFETYSFDAAHVFGMLKYILITTTAVYTALMMYLPSLDKQLKPNQIPGCKEIQSYKDDDNFAVPVQNESCAVWFHGGPGVLRATDSVLQTNAYYILLEKNHQHYTGLGMGVLGRYIAWTERRSELQLTGPGIRVEDPLVAGNKYLDRLDKLPSVFVLFVSIASGKALSTDQITELAWVYIGVAI